MVTHSIHSEEETVCLTRFTKSSQNGNLESSQFSNDKYSHGWGKRLLSCHWNVYYVELMVC